MYVTLKCASTCTQLLLLYVRNKVCINYNTGTQALRGKAACLSSIYYYLINCQGVKVLVQFLSNCQVFMMEKEGNVDSELKAFSSERTGSLSFGGQSTGPSS